MSQVIVGMTTSLDGFVNDRNGSVERLYPDLEALRKTEFLKEAIAYTGAVVMGRRAYDMANGDFTDYEFQVPIFVVTHRPPAEKTKGQNANLVITFVTEGTEAAVNRARKAAGSKEVTVVGGADTAQQIIRAGLADQLEVGIVPVLFGEGLRLFENLGDRPPEFETIKVMQSPGRTDIRYRIVK
jgi:dihydrofolate reductase